jgi:hypothetical protein
VYTEHLKTLPPQEVPFLPAPDQSVQFPPLSNLAEEDREILSDEWHRDVEAGVLEAFPLMVERLRKHKERLVALLPSDDSQPIASEDLSDAELDAKLALATTVYSFQLTRYFGPEAFMRRGDERVALSDGHVPSYTEMPKTLVFAKYDHDAVLTILACLDKDRATTAAALDAADDRLLCLHCSMMPRMVYSWREAVRPPPLACGDVWPVDSLACLQPTLGRACARAHQAHRDAVGRAQDARARAGRARAHHAARAAVPERAERAAWLWVLPLQRAPRARARAADVVLAALARAVDDARGRAAARAEPVCGVLSFAMVWVMRLLSVFFFSAGTTSKSRRTARTTSGTGRLWRGRRISSSTVRWQNLRTYESVVAADRFSNKRLFTIFPATMQIA